MIDNLIKEELLKIRDGLNNGVKSKELLVILDGIKSSLDSNYSFISWDFKLEPGLIYDDRKEFYEYSVKLVCYTPRSIYEIYTLKSNVINTMPIERLEKAIYSSIIEGVMTDVMLGSDDASLRLLIGEPYRERIGTNFNTMIKREVERNKWRV